MANRKKKYELDLNVVFEGGEADRRVAVNQNPRHRNQKRNIVSVGPSDHNRGSREVQVDAEVAATEGRVGARVEEEKPERWDVRLGFPCEPPF